MGYGRDHWPRTRALPGRVQAHPGRVACVCMYSTCVLLTEARVVPDLHSLVVKRKD